MRASLKVNTYHKGSISGGQRNRRFCWEALNDHSSRGRHLYGPGAPIEIPGRLRCDFNLSAVCAASGTPPVARPMNDCDLKVERRGEDHAFADIGNAER